MRVRPISEASLLAIVNAPNDMRWEVPRAIDFRFGMEITLYIGRR